MYSMYRNGYAQDLDSTSICLDFVYTVWSDLKKNHTHVNWHALCVAI